jgi:AraC-like DNA-binding protein
MLAPLLPTIQNTITVLPLKPYDLECISAVHQMLSKNPVSRLTIEALAIEIGINRNKLHYGFRQVYGLTIHDFMEQQRMKKAEELLVETYKSIKAIAALTGYKSSSSFGDMFKKKTGLSPLQFRKQAWMQLRALKSENRDTFRENADILP